MTVFVGLLRAINVGGRKLSMSELREVVQSLDYTDVQTYIQSGNLIFSGNGTPSLAEERLESAIKAEFGMIVPTIVRTTSQWKNYLNPPFSATALTTPNHVVLGLSKSKPSPSAAKLLRERAVDGECIEIQGDAIWLCYPNGIGGSKITPAFIDKATGSSTTARNLNTVRKLAQMCGIENYDSHTF